MSTMGHHDHVVEESARINGISRPIVKHHSLVNTVKLCLLLLLNLCNALGRNHLSSGPYPGLAWGGGPKGGGPVGLNTDTKGMYTQFLKGGGRNPSPTRPGTGLKPVVKYVFINMMKDYKHLWN